MKLSHFAYYKKWTKSLPLNIPIPFRSNTLYMTKKKKKKKGTPSSRVRIFRRFVKVPRALLSLSPSRSLFPPFLSDFNLHSVTSVGCRLHSDQRQIWRDKCGSPRVEKERKRGMETGTTLDNDARWIFEERLVTPTNSNSSTSIALWYIRGLFGNETRWTRGRVSIVYLSEELSVVFVGRRISDYLGNLGKKVGRIMGRGALAWRSSRADFSKSRAIVAPPLSLTSRLSREQRFQTFVPATRIWNKIGYLYTNEFLTNKFRLFRSYLF